MRPTRIVANRSKKSPIKQLPNTADNAAKKPLSTSPENHKQEHAKNRAIMGAVDELNQAVSQCRSLLDLLLHQICFDRCGERQVSEQSEVGLNELCHSGSGRLESASRELRRLLA